MLAIPATNMTPTSHVLEALIEQVILPIASHFDLSFELLWIPYEAMANNGKQQTKCHLLDLIEQTQHRIGQFGVIVVG
jgi:hypothetical protein